MMKYGIYFLQTMKEKQVQKIVTSMKLPYIYACYVLYSTYFGKS